MTDPPRVPRRQGGRPSLSCPAWRNPAPTGARPHPRQNCPFVNYLRRFGRGIHSRSVMRATSFFRLSGGIIRHPLSCRWPLPNRLRAWSVAPRTPASLREFPATASSPVFPPHGSCVPPGVRPPGPWPTERTLALAQEAANSTRSSVNPDGASLAPPEIPIVRRISHHISCLIAYCGRSSVYKPVPCSAHCYTNALAFR